ncbi:hypothetical protein [Streptomyces sp. NPDC049879]|uniref:LppU/SCO3897 family protein n=1 Tax=Streptomyces sp. NPDC049879 TaxID=3365598 RepID=UPI0037A06478
MNNEGRSGVWLLVVALVAFAALILPNAVGGGGSAALPSSVPSAPPAGPPAPAPAPSHSPEPPPDPTGEAFEAVRTGDCLSVHDTGTGAWSSELPSRVPCDEATAYVLVTDVLAQAADCPEGPGRSFWSYTWGVQTVALCLERQFETGYCMLGQTTDQEDGMRAGLLSVVECDARTLPDGYDTVLHISGVEEAPADMTGPLCARAEGDPTEYWYWIVDGGRTLVCTMEYTGEWAG